MLNRWPGILWNIFTRKERNRRESVRRFGIFYRLLFHNRPWRTTSLFTTHGLTSLSGYSIKQLSIDGSRVSIDLVSHLFSSPARTCVDVRSLNRGIVILLSANRFKKFLIITHTQLILVLCAISQRFSYSLSSYYAGWFWWVDFQTFLTSCLLWKTWSFVLVFVMGWKVLILSSQLWDLCQFCLFSLHIWRLRLSPCILFTSPFSVVPYITHVMHSPLAVGSLSKP